MMFAMATARNTTLYDDHTKPHSHLTHAQLTFFISCLSAAALWLIRIPNVLRRQTLDDNPQDAESGKVLVKLNGRVNGIESDVTENDVKAVKASTSSVPPPPPTIDEVLRDVVVFGLIMVYFFLCDYIKVRIGGCGVCVCVCVCVCCVLCVVCVCVVCVCVCV